MNKDNRHRCSHFRPWVVTSKGEITSACVDEAKRTIEQCEWTPKHGCPKGVLINNKPNNDDENEND